MSQIPIPPLVEHYQKKVMDRSLSLTERNNYKNLLLDLRDHIDKIIKYFEDENALKLGGKKNEPRAKPST